MHPKDEFGDYDFETPYALDLELINQHLVDLPNCPGPEDEWLPGYGEVYGHAAVIGAKDFVTRALRSSPGLGGGRGPIDPTVAADLPA